jgi:hypothetical protein
MVVKGDATMTNHFWVGEPRKARKPELPIPVGKAHQKLSQAIICGDDELASWIDSAFKRNLVTGDPHAVQQLRERLDAVMAPLDDAADV